MKTSRNTYATAALILLLSVPQACIPGKQLITEAAAPADIKGIYTLVLYGCRYPDDIENMAILVDEGGAYPVEVYAPEFMYKVKKGLSAQQAFKEAEAFIQCSFRKFRQSQLRRIPDDAGRTVGYEMKPLYFPFEFGISEVILASYSLKGGKVTVYIRLDPSVERTRDSLGAIPSSERK